MNRITLCSLMCLIAALPSAAQQIEGHAKIASLVTRAIEAGDLPGAVVCFADASEIRYLECFGDRQVFPQSIPMTADTVFDLASITKPVATGTSIAMLCQSGTIDPLQTVSHYLPEFTGHDKETITVEQCLLHTSGLIPDNALADYQSGERVAWEKICGMSLRSKPGTEFAYSDVGFIVLGKLVEKVAGMPLDVFVKAQVYDKLDMFETSYKPDAALRLRSAPTELLDGQWICGSVHDPRAARMGGVAGHAGLFSTAHDLVRFGQALLAADKGNSDLINQTTLERMIAPHEIPRGTRTFGWDHQSPYSINRGTALSMRAFGHGGFTGTVLWIDPDKQLIFVFLSNRLHPDGKGSVNQLAGDIVTQVAENWTQPAIP